MKVYSIKLSRHFLKGHPRASEPTYFVEKFLKGQGMYRAEIDEEFGRLLFPKIHTLRANYEEWARRIEEVQTGKAKLCVQYWHGVPFRSKVGTICDLTAEHGVGVQKVEFSATLTTIDDIEQELDIDVMAHNDGLAPKDFCDWFKGYDLTKPLALIHFTNFRY